MKRRRFIERFARFGIGAGAGCSLSACQKGVDLTLWKELSMGIAVSVQYKGEAEVEPAWRKVTEAEKALTLWSDDSALSRLNREGVLINPPAALLACLEKSRILFEASGGVFDPSVHSFLQWLRAEYREGAGVKETAVMRKLKQVDFAQVEFSKSKVTMPPGYALSFNAIAQGYLTDLFVEHFSARSALVNFGEFRVMGPEPWPVEVKGEAYPLRRALAVSSGSGQRLSATAAANHLIDPQSGKSPPPRKVVAVEADEAWLADGLSTIVAIGGHLPPRFDGALVL